MINFLSLDKVPFHLDALARFQQVQSFFCFHIICGGSQIREHVQGQSSSLNRQGGAFGSKDIGG